VDGLGNPVVFLLSPGNDHDSTHAVEVLRKVQIEGSNVLGDRAYGSQEIREYITDHRAGYTISRKSSGFVESLPDTTNWIPLSSPLFISPLLSSGYFRRFLFIFQTGPNSLSQFYSRFLLTGLFTH